MEAGERMTVKIILTAIVLVGCNIVAAGAAGDADIQGGALDYSVNWQTRESACRYSCFLRVYRLLQNLLITECKQTK